MHGRLSVIIVGLVALLATSPAAASPLSAPQCFPTVPGIADCIDGRFATFWNNNGGLPVFGYPITPVRPEVNADTKQTYSTQWFERNRYEQHPENQPPYDVLLGRLGAELLLAQGRDWHNEPNNGNPLGGTCQHFDATNRDVCGPFLTYWAGHGLNDPLLSAYNRSLQLFGLPLTGVKMEKNPNGDTVETQWFERARFEFHPEVGNIVLLGLLGRERLVSSPPPPPPPTGGVAGPCAQNAPAPTDNGQAWVTNPTPSQNSDQTLCARLSLYGAPQANVAVTIMVHYKSTVTTYTGTTDSPGVAAITFRVGGASLGYTVQINVQFGSGQTATTSFTPQ